MERSGLNRRERGFAAALLLVVAFASSPEAALAQAGGPMGMAQPPHMTPPPPPPPVAIMPSPMGTVPMRASSQGAGKSQGSGVSPSDARLSLFPAHHSAQPLSNVGITTMVGGTHRQLVTDGRGFASIGTLGRGTTELAIPVQDLPKTSAGAGPTPRVLVGILTPGPGGSQQLVEFTYRKSKVADGIRVKINVSSDGRGTTVDWGGGTRQVSTLHDGKRVGSPGGGTKTDTIIQISHMIMFQQNNKQDDPCPQGDPWLCMGGPPPDDNPPQWEYPWWQIDPEDNPIPNTEIYIDGGGNDEIKQTKTDDQGIFTFPSAFQAPRTIRIALPPDGSIAYAPPKPPVKVALVLPTGLARSRRSLKMLEHIYAPNTQAQTLKVVMTPIKDAAGRIADVVVDWGDGTPKVTLSHNGKVVRADAVDPQVIGRVIFTSATRK